MTRVRRIAIVVSVIVVSMAIAGWMASGLRVTYFADTAWQTRLYTAIDRHVTSEAVVQDAPVPVNGPFSARWTGFIRIPSAGRYQVSAFCEGGMVSVAIDRKTVDDAVSLEAGVHPIVIA